MDLINELGNEIAFAVLVEKRLDEKIDSNQVLPLICKVREALQPISCKNQLDVIETAKSLNATTNLQ